MTLPSWAWWSLLEIPLTIAVTHLTISLGQTLMHYWLGHRRIGGVLFRNHINFHHAFYTRGRLATAVQQGSEGNNTPFFLVPVVMAACALFFILPTGLFAVAIGAAGLSFYAHVHFDNAYHISGSYLERFAWFQRKRQLHFVHHLHANKNFAVIDFFWDRMLGTFRKAGPPAH